MSHWRLLGTKVSSLCMNAVTEGTMVTAMTCWRLQGTAVDVLCMNAATTERTALTIVTDCKKLGAAVFLVVSASLGVHTYLCHVEAKAAGLVTQMWSRAPRTLR